METNESENLMREAISAVSLIMPDGYGILLIVVPLDESHRVVKYASTMPREHAMEILKQFMYYCGEEEAWMRHLI